MSNLPVMPMNKQQREQVATIREAIDTAGEMLHDAGADAAVVFTIKENPDNPKIPFVMFRVIRPDEGEGPLSQKGILAIVSMAVDHAYQDVQQAEAAVAAGAVKN